MKTRSLVALAVAPLLCAAALSFNTRAGSQSMSADLVIINANVHTLEKSQPAAEAVAVLGNKIIAVGTSADIQKLVGARTRVIDARGALVMPGFNDAHVHFTDGGQHLASVQLRDAASPEEFARRIAEFAAKTPSGRWITGGDWDHERWTPPALPTKELIDKYTGDHPVFVNRLDGHMGLANSLALRLAGVTKDTPDPPGGLIVRDPKTGEPTGVLKDAAQSFVYAKMPDPSWDERLDYARAATNHASSVGVTSVQDMSAGTDVGVYQFLASRGELKTRVYAVSPLADWERLGRVGVRARFGGDLIRIGGLKGFADGSLGSTTALFFEPYLDAPNTSGIPSDELYTPEKMYEHIRAADRAGLQVMIHAIGDKANDTILSFYERLIKEDGERDRRYRIEHAQHLRPQDIARFGRDHVVASMQPYHCIDDGRWAEHRIGHERAKTTYAFRSLLDSGATLAFGTDWFVAPLNPLLGIYAAATRRTTDGKNPQGWIPEQKITVEEAVRAYTIGSAFAEFTDDVKGTLAPGKLADLVIIDRDIFKIDPVEIEKAKVTTTIMDGRVVYEADGRG
ncbi:MAG: amidohydrolase [Acidobacteriota bacterium]|nr:amidohydrolase [Acidobacteriota bacterium]